ncbi:MAG: 3-deoxy-manno-octulosonate cytidylyltransferase [Haliangiales bacterium]
MSSAGFRIVIPARYGSSRLPGKPLMSLAGRPMIEWVWRSAASAGADAVVVATDDARIFDAVRGFGGEALMTATTHRSGTDRLAEAADALGWPADAVVVNLQGDEPCVPGALLRQLAESLLDRPDAGMATVATPITAGDELFNPNVVKVVLNDAGLAQYFSRAPIPWLRDMFDVLTDRTSEAVSLPSGVPFLRHLGLYAYRVATLARIARAEPNPLERAESLEQLRALGLGIGIFVSVVAEAPGHGVDTPGDIERVAAYLTSGAREPS